MKQEDQPGASFAEVPSEHDASLGFFCHVSLRISFILFTPQEVCFYQEGEKRGPPWVRKPATRTTGAHSLTHH